MKKTLSWTVTRLRDGVFKVALMDGDRPFLAKTIQAPNERLFKKRIGLIARRMTHQARVRFGGPVEVR